MNKDDDRKQPKRAMNERDLDALLHEHQEMCSLLGQAVDAMNVTQRLFDLSNCHMLMSKCREIERWLDTHETQNHKRSDQAR